MSREQEFADRISRAEEAWLDTLMRFLQEYFKDTFLPSHDHTHHLRTWKNAKLILGELSEFNQMISDELVEAVLIASLFHDCGIVETRGTEHGKKSKEVYLGYISGEASAEPAMHRQIARAIELHDMKTKNQFVPFHWNKPPDLLTVVSMADDMDALGTIGVYRYAEIYLHREVPMKSLGMVLLENVSTRFNNFVKAAGLVPSLIKRCKATYQEIISFYDSYNQQLLAEEDPYTVFSGHIGVVNYIRNFSVIGRILPQDFPEALDNFTAGKFVIDFFNKLEKDLLEGNRL